MRRGGEHAHVQACFGDDCPGQVQGDAGDLGEPGVGGQHGRVRAGVGGRGAGGVDAAGGGDLRQAGFDVVFDGGDGAVEEGDVVQVDADQPGVVAYKLAWDIVGTEFAGRHMLYEKFYAGSSIVVRNQSDREAPWQSFHDTVDRLLAGIEVPQSGGTKS